MFRIVEPNGKRITIANFFTRESAQLEINSWIARWHRGGRQDVSLERLQALIIEEYIPDYQ